jgi:hypothetical protein
MFGFDVEGRYKHDSTFRLVVDQMRALLSAYHITPSELREASVLAATMHEFENVRPLLVDGMHDYGWQYYKLLSPMTQHVYGPTRTDFGSGYRVCTRCGLSNVYVDSLKEKPPCRTGNTKP